MNNIDESNRLKNNMNDIEEEVKTLYEENDDKKELDYLVKQIDFNKIDDDNDFHKSFINQLIYFIKSDEEKDFFDFKIKKNTSILDFIINYSSKFKIINKIHGKKRGKENNVKNLDNNKNTIIKNEESKELNNRCININSYESKSSLSFSINKSNLADLNKSSDKSKENIKAKENMMFIKKNFAPEEYETKIKDIEKEKRNISYYEDDSEINGNAFENDSIHYIFKKLYSVAKNNDCSIIYNIEPNIEKINSIFKGNNKLNRKKSQKFQKNKYTFFINLIKTNNCYFY